MLRFTAAVQPLSCDEAYLDLTGLGDPDALVAALRADIAATTGCTASAGARARALRCGAVPHRRRRRRRPSSTCFCRRTLRHRRASHKHALTLPTRYPSVLNETGIGPNLLLSRIATGRAKPNGQLRVRPGAEALAFLYELKVSAIPGIGYATAEKLEEKLGITQACSAAQRATRSAQRMRGWGRKAANAAQIDPPSSSTPPCPARRRQP
jgi:DNA repair protein REV1